MLSKLGAQAALATLFVQNVAADAGFTHAGTSAAFGAAVSCADCILNGHKACVNSGSEGTLTDNSANADWECVASSTECSASQTTLYANSVWDTAVYMSAIMNCPIKTKCGAETVKVFAATTDTDAFTITSNLEAQENCNWIFKSTAGPPAV